MCKSHRERRLAIGSGFYGVDIKDRNGTPFIIEVNDNPSLEAGEDEHSPGLYNKIIAHLLGDGETPAGSDPAR